MKKYIAFSILAASVFCGCNESEFLKEEPLDFLSTSNSFTTEQDFQASVIGLYNQVRYEFYGYDESKPFDYIYGTDLIFDSEPGTYARHGNMKACYDPTSNVVRIHWENLYKLIAEANTVVDRAEISSLSDQFKTQIIAKGRFFRGLGYRTLAYLYGGVPLEIHEVASPKADYVRATKEETLTQAMEDVKFAAENLPDIKAVKDGEISSAAAYHLLSEIYLALGKNQEAADAATKVISNPALALMTTRFGSHAGEADKDVYYDLFRENNQNRGSGNTEGIWVIQYDTDVNGGGSSTSGLKVPHNYMLERNCCPQVQNFTITINGKKYTPFKWPVSDFTSGGRGIGWGPSTIYFSRTIWQDDFNGDMRNANHNFVRKFKVTQSKLAEEQGITEIDIDNIPAGATIQCGPKGRESYPNRYMFAWQTKATTPGCHPEAMYQDPAQKTLKSIAGTTYVDQYMFRLAETYLLRAEAYLMLNQKDKAADDINVVRGRAHAIPCTPAQVDMDYILDERMRELGIEEKRRVTLMRTQTLYKRVMKCNPYYANPATNGDGIGMLEKYNVWPIPHNVIEANTDAKIIQNEGYPD